jgi:amino acid transporter
MLILVSYAIPIVAYSYIGIEAIAVTAFEAKNSTSLKWPSKIIAYAIFVMYFLCTLGEVLTVKWTDPRLPLIYGGVGNGTTSANTNTPPNSTIIVVNAAWAAGYRTLAGFLNGCLIFSALSASNTDLYVSSRTLYGIARDISPQSWLGKIVRFVHLSVVTQTGVPAGAILFSFLSFIWLPFLQWKGGYAIQDVSQPP